MKNDDMTKKEEQDLKLYKIASIFNGARNLAFSYLSEHDEKYLPKISNIVKLYYLMEKTWPDQLGKPEISGFSYQSTISDPKQSTYDIALTIIILWREMTYKLERASSDDEIAYLEFGIKPLFYVIAKAHKFVILEDTWRNLEMNDNHNSSINFMKNTLKKTADVLDKPVSSKEELKTAIENAQADLTYNVKYHFNQQINEIHEIMGL